jgi:hypothetical protein
LLRAAKGVAYELEMMGAMSRPMTDGRDVSRLAGTALLEAYLTHVRCLHEFLAFGPPRGERMSHTVRAVHYLPATAEPVPCLDESGGLYEHLSRKLSHTTCDREDAYSWGETPDALAEPAVAVFTAFEAFVEQLRSGGLIVALPRFEAGLLAGQRNFEDAQRGAFVFARR